MGTLARPHGIKGEICIDWYADSPLLLSTPLWLQKGKDAPRRVKIAAVRSHKERPLLQLEGVADRTAAEALRGCKLMMQREDLPEPDEIAAEILGHLKVAMEEIEALAELLESAE